MVFKILVLIVTGSTWAGVDRSVNIPVQSDLTATSSTQFSETMTKTTSSHFPSSSNTNSYVVRRQSFIM